eukprot:2175462-Heterocapsa_arctica.AAC.1
MVDDLLHADRDQPMGCCGLTTGTAGVLHWPPGRGCVHSPRLNGDGRLLSQGREPVMPLSAMMPAMSDCCGTAPQAASDEPLQLRLVPPRPRSR